MHWKWPNKLKYNFGHQRPFYNGRCSAINSQSPVSSERLVNLEKRSISDSQAPKLDGVFILNNN